VLIRVTPATYQRAGPVHLFAMTQLLTEDHPAYAGQAQYTPKFLAHIYDPLVVRFANRFGWRCTSRRILRFYDDNVATEHLDVGPGTGWFLARCRFPSPTPRITLLDVNSDVLDAASKRIARYNPARRQANVLEPIELEDKQFGSAALIHVLHCLPGPIAEKAGTLDHAAALVRPGGTLFGTTVLTGGVTHTRFSRSYNEYLNEIGVFSNLGDDLDGLDRTLSERFKRYQLHIEGVVALFTAQVGNPTETS
jgi:ubiquinone/menaquinone biosynthesis C-methylase UbiE